MLGRTEDLNFRKTCTFHLSGVDDQLYAQAVDEQEKRTSSGKYLLVRISEALLGLAHMAGLLSGSETSFSVGTKVARVTENAAVSKVHVSLIDVGKTEKILPDVAQPSQHFREVLVLAKKNRNAIETA